MRGGGEHILQRGGDGLRAYLGGTGDGIVAGGGEGVGGGELGGAGGGADLAVVDGEGELGGLGAVEVEGDVGMLCGDYIPLIIREKEHLQAVGEHVEEDVGVVDALTLEGVGGVAEYEGEFLNLLRGIGDVVVGAEVADVEFPKVRAYVVELILRVVVAPGGSVLPVGSGGRLVGDYAGVGIDLGGRGLVHQPLVTLVGVEIYYHILRVLLQQWRSRGDLRRH